MRNAPKLRFGHEPTSDTIGRELETKLNPWMQQLTSLIAKGFTKGNAPTAVVNPNQGGMEKFFYLPGRSGGQVGYGDTTASGILVLSSTNHGTKGKIYFGQARGTVYDEVNNRVGIGNTSPEAPLHVMGEVSGTTRIRTNPSAVPVSSNGGWGVSCTAPRVCAGGGPDALSEATMDGASSFIFNLAGIANPSDTYSLSSGATPSTLTSHVLKIAARKTVAGAKSLPWALIDGATAAVVKSGTIALTQVGAETDSFTTTSIPLTSVEAALITNYATIQIRFGGVLGWASGYLQDDVRVSWVQLEYANSAVSSGSAETIIAEQASAGVRVLRFVPGTGTDLVVLTPTSGSNPWLFSPDGSGKIAFHSWDEVRVSGTNTAFKIAATSTTGTWLAATGQGSNAYGNVSITGETDLVDAGVSASWGDVLTVGVTTDGATRGMRIFGKSSGQTADIINIGVGPLIGGIRTIFDKDANLGIRTGAIALSASLQVYPGATNTTGVIIRGLAAQTGDLLLIQDSTPTTKLQVTAAGKLVLNVAPQINVPAGAVVTGQAWLATDVNGNGAWTTISTSEVESLGRYGDGTDGAITLNGGAAPTGMSLIGSTYFMSRDWYFDTLTIANGFTLNPAGWRIFAKTSVTVASGAFLITNGNAGTAGLAAGTAATGGTGGAGLSDTGSTPLGGSAQGSNGRTGTTGAGGLAGFGSPETGEGGNGGSSGQGEASFTGAAGGIVRIGGAMTIGRWRQATGTVMAYNFLLLVSGGAGGTGGSSGGSDGVFKGAGGGGGGSGGGVLAVWAKTISNSGTISTNGGAGGGGGATDGSGGAGGGGGGGGGGFVYLHYDTLTNSGTITASGGTGGATGTLGGFSSPTAATNGSAGNVVKYSRLTGLFT